MMIFRSEREVDMDDATDKPWLGKVLKDAKKAKKAKNERERIGMPNPTIYLFQKWAFKVERNWYGFDLEGVPFDWANKIDELLTWTNDHIPEFKIHQIKLKFGGIRIYLDLGLPDNLIQDDILKEYKRRVDKLQDECFDKELIY